MCEWKDNSLVSRHNPQPKASRALLDAIPKQSVCFRLWKGSPIADTYGNKAILDCDGEPVFAELAILRSLQKEGFDGVWVDGFRKCFRRSRSEDCILPPHASEFFDSIVRANDGKRAGCWDMFAWKDGEYLFVEPKRRDRDRMRDTQVKWLQAALRAGVALSSFRICEWDIEGN